MRKYCQFCRTLLDHPIEKNACITCIEKLIEDGASFFVNLHNERVKNYWNRRLQTIGCRVRVTKKGNARNFRRNIIEFLYNFNVRKLSEALDLMYEEDQILIDKKFGFDEFNEIQKTRELTTEEKQRQFALAMAVRDKEDHKFDVIGLLELFEVGVTKIKGYYKELFYLKCIMNEINPAVYLRGLYRLENPSKLNLTELLEEKIPSLTNYDIEITQPSFYQQEIRLIIDNYIIIKNLEEGLISKYEF